MDELLTSRPISWDTKLMICATPSLRVFEMASGVTPSLNKVSLVQRPLSPILVLACLALFRLSLMRATPVLVRLLLMTETPPAALV